MSLGFKSQTTTNYIISSITTSEKNWIDLLYKGIHMVSVTTLIICLEIIHFE